MNQAFLCQNSFVHVSSALCSWCLSQEFEVFRGPQKESHVSPCHFKQGALSSVVTSACGSPFDAFEILVFGVECGKIEAGK